MIIGIDFREGARSQRAGKGEYVFQLVRSMLEQLRPGEKVVLLVENGQVVDLPEGGWTMLAIPGRSWAWQFLTVLWLTFKKPFSVYFSTTSIIVPALVVRQPVITTLFDFTVWRFPGTHLSRAVRIERLFMRRALHRSARLLSISEFTKQEAITLFGIHKDRITVTPLAVDKNFKKMSLSPEAIERLQQKYNLPQKFLLYLGTLEPRKNLSRLAAAFLSVQDSLNGAKLVLAGGRGWKLALADITHDDIYTPGYIDDEDRPMIYNLARALVFPSLYEGFGLPPLEAMSCGTPVVVGNSSSLPEVVSTAAILVDPTDTQSLARALIEVSTSVETRQRLSRDGLVQAGKFQWSKTAEQTLLVIRQIAND